MLFRFFPFVGTVLFCYRKSVLPVIGRVLFRLSEKHCSDHRKKNYSISGLSLPPTVSM